MHNNANIGSGKRRPRIAFFDYPDVFEDFYPHYDVDQHSFGTTWQNTANHRRITLIQKEIGDVIWYVTCLKTDVGDTKVHANGFRVKFLPSSWLHRQLWRIYYIHFPFWRWSWTFSYFAVISSYLAPLSLKLIYTLYKDRPDIIFTQDYCSGRFDVLLCIAKLFGVNLATIHTGSTSEFYLGKWLKPITIPKADWIFASGKKEYQRLKTEYNVPITKLSVITALIDIEMYKPMDRDVACSKLGINPQRRYILYLGRLDDGVKRISSILNVFGRFAHNNPDFDLLIAGKGQDERLLKDKVRALSPGRVHFLGWIGEEQKKAELYNAAECLVLASQREGFPSVVGEALACGLPIISSDVGSISDVVHENRTGWLFRSGDEETMYHALIRIANQNGTTSSMRAEIRRYAVQNLSVEVGLLALKEGFNTLMDCGNDL